MRMEDETVWLNRQQLALLFARDIKTIGKHIKNALMEELADMATVANFATVQQEGNRTVTRYIEYYNLDMILSVGYRVKSRRGIEFRRWANNVLKEHLLKGYSVNSRLTELEHTVAEHSKKIDFFVRTSLPPVEGTFFNGQIFDAYKFATDYLSQCSSTRYRLPFPMLQHRRSRCQVIVVYSCDRQTEIHHCLVAGIEVPQDFIPLVYTAGCVVRHIEACAAGHADRDVAVHCQQLDIRVLLQLTVYLFLRRSSKIQSRALLQHNLKHADLRTVSLDSASATSLCVLRNSNAFSIFIFSRLRQI